MGPLAALYHRQYEKSATRQARSEPFSLSRRLSLNRGAVGFGAPRRHAAAAAPAGIAQGFGFPKKGSASTNVACDSFTPAFHRHESVTFWRASFWHAALVRGPKEPPMIGLVRAATVC